MGTELMHTKVKLHFILPEHEESFKKDILNTYEMYTKRKTGLPEELEMIESNYHWLEKISSLHIYGNMDAYHRLSEKETKQFLRDIEKEYFHDFSSDLLEIILNEFRLSFEIAGINNRKFRYLNMPLKEVW